MYHCLCENAFMFLCTKASSSDKIIIIIIFERRPFYFITFLSAGRMCLFTCMCIVYAYMRYFERLHRSKLKPIRILCAFMANIVHNQKWELTNPKIIIITLSTLSTRISSHSTCAYGYCLYVRRTGSTWQLGIVSSFLYGI